MHTEPTMIFYRVNIYNETVYFLAGACEGTLACSTCHLVFKKEDFDKIKDEVTDEELDMLDLAYGLTDTYVRKCLRHL